MGTEFVLSDRGSVMIIDRDLIVLKSSGAAWHTNLADKLNSMGYLYADSDPDVWFKRFVKPSGEEY